MRDELTLDVYLLQFSVAELVYCCGTIAPLSVTKSFNDSHKFWIAGYYYVTTNCWMSPRESWGLGKETHIKEKKDREWWILIIKEITSHNTPVQFVKRIVGVIVSISVNFQINLILETEKSRNFIESEKLQPIIELHKYEKSFTSVSTISGVFCGSFI